jgi:glyoxylase-like metal-dependent hydrolase (beta-lactamase superfamily II)
MLRRQTLPVTAFAQNCSLVWCSDTLEAALIDPGGEPARLLAAAARAGVRLRQVLLTHAHIDHAGAAGQLAREHGLPIVGPHEGDRFWIDALAQQARMFGLGPSEPFEPARWLVDGDTVQVGEVTLSVRHCPGHTPGHVVFHDPATHTAFVGDVLFAGSVGRTDFPGGDFDTLAASIRGRLWPMGDDTVFVPGHGPESTFGAERRSNPFVADGLR